MRNIVIFILLYLLSGCSTPALFVQNEQKIGIIADQKHISVDAKSIISENITMDRLRIHRTLYEVDNVAQRIVYEDVKAQSPYQFQYDIPKTIGILFETNNYTMIDRIGNLSFFIIKIKNKKELLLIAQNLNKKGLRIVYGLNTKQLQSAFEHVKSKKSATINNPVFMLPDDKSAFLIRWNAKMTLIDGLLRHQSMKAMRF